MTPDSILADLRVRFRLLTAEEIAVMRGATWAQVGEAVVGRAYGITRREPSEGPQPLLSRHGRCDGRSMGQRIYPGGRMTDHRNKEDRLTPRMDALVRQLHSEREIYRERWERELEAHRWIPVSERLPEDEQVVLAGWLVLGCAETLRYHAADAPDGPAAWRDWQGNEADAPTHWKRWEGPQ